MVSSVHSLPGWQCMLHLARSFGGITEVGLSFYGWSIIPHEETGRDFRAIILAAIRYRATERNLQRGGRQIVKIGGFLLHG